MTGFDGSAGPLRILIVDDEATIRTTLTLCLEADGHSVKSCSNAADALAQVSAAAFDLIFLDMRLGTDDGLDLIAPMQRQCPSGRIIVITAYASVETAVKAMKRGAADYLSKPFTPVEVERVTRSVAQRRRLEWRLDELKQALGAMDPDADFTTGSGVMKRALDVARQVATSNANVLIRGEPGTGKSRLARAIHTWSTRRDAPFGISSCHATSADALDIHLFGSASSGDQDQPGRIAYCEGGTLVLEEIGFVPPSLQLKLAIFLREKCYERYDDVRTRQANVRIVATSGIDLELAVKRKRFRPELLLALDVIRIDLPPLRERGDDLFSLADRYLAFFSREHHRQISEFTPEARSFLANHSWPGNTRELRNVIERAVLLCNDDRIDVRHFPANLIGRQTSVRIGDLVPLDVVEDHHIRAVLESTGSIKGAAAVLDVDPSTVQRWLRRQQVTRHPVISRTEETAVGRGVTIGGQGV